MVKSDVLYHVIICNRKLSGYEKVFFFLIRISFGSVFVCACSCISDSVLRCIMDSVCTLTCHPQPAPESELLSSHLEGNPRYHLQPMFTLPLPFSQAKLSVLRNLLYVQREAVSPASLT